MSRPASTHHHGPLAGVSAGAAAVLFAFGVLALAWHRVAGPISTAITVLVYVVITAVCGLALAALFYAVLWLRHRVRHPETLAGRQGRPVYQLAAGRQASYARYCDTARRGAFGPADHFGLCTLTDTLEVLGLEVDELERRALGQLAAGDPLIVAVVDDLLNRAARNEYDPVRYAVSGPPERHLRAIPPSGNPFTRKDPDSR